MAVLLSILTALMGLSLFDGPEDRAVDGEQPAGRVPLATAPPRPPLALPPISGARDPARPLVVIDPGHGGPDPGALSSTGRAEKDVALALAKAIHDELAASARVRVALTRSGDRALSLEDRYEIARRLGASLFLSVHADAAPRNDSARGATVYTLSEIASDREAALLAARENGPPRIGGADASEEASVNRILIDLAQREAMTASTEFARLLHREASPLFPFQPDWHRFAAFAVLKAPDIPSVLFESGYLTNAADEAFLTSPTGRQRIAEGMRRAIETYLARRAAAHALKKPGERLERRG